MKRTLALNARRRESLRTCLQVVGAAALLVVVCGSAVIVKHAQSGAGGLPLVAFAGGDTAPAIAGEPVAEWADLEIIDPLNEIDAAPEESPVGPNDVDYPPDTRWFDGRPMRPARTIQMTVTAYSPGAESCGKFADGITSSLHSVDTNAMQLVAADTRILPLGSVITVPGYRSTKLVPVLDRGGKIKGNRLDVLFATAEQARAWGVKKLSVVVWEYADGKPAPEWRKIRDSRN